MENQPSNAGMWSEWSKWLQFPPQDGAHGELGPNGGGSGSTVQPRDVRNVISEIEGTSTANGSGVNVAATLPGPSARPQGSVPGGLEGSPANVRAMSNPVGWEENGLTSALVANRAGLGVQTMPGPQISSLGNPLMPNLAVDGIQTITVALPTTGHLVISSGSQPATSAGRSRGPLLPVDPEMNVTKLKTRLVEGGATMEAADLIDGVFRDGVTRDALERRLTHSQCKKLGLRDGKTFQILLEKVGVVGQMRNRCRLCPTNDAMVYKNHRDALRHFLKDHFGLSFECMHCGYKGFTKSELTKHIKTSHSVVEEV